MPEVRCPKCGASMVTREGKRGRFLGCSRFPKCRGTRDFESTPIDSQTPEEKAGKKSLSVFSFPRTLRARARFQGYQVRFFEIVAVPEDLLEIINSEEVDEEILKCFSQWRVEFPIRESESTLNERQSQIISVIEKILIRGRITLPSPELEKEFRERFLKTSKTALSLSPMKYLAFKRYQKPQKHIWLDSKEETIFYEDIIPQFLGENYKQFLIPQTEILSLLPPNPDADITGYHKWVDFAIFHPKLEEKIIVEIDGEQHKEQIEADKERDRALQEFGYTVIRIPANEVQKRSGPQLSTLQNKLSVIKEQKFYDDTDSFSSEIIKFLQSIKIAHQIQIILLQALQTGFLSLDDTGLWEISVDTDQLSLFNKEESLGILKSTVNDFVNLLANLCKLYSIEIKGTKPRCNLFSEQSMGVHANKIFISFTDKFTSDLTTFHIQNIYFPFHIANSSYSTIPVIGGLEKPEEKDLEYFLQYLFRKPYFWEGQYEGITRALQGKDGLLLLPTGAGKSLVYQLTSLLLPGRTIVIDPIISLMEDQIDNLALMGIDRCIAITSQIIDPKDKSRAIQLFGQGEYLFAYVAPERFQTVEFRESLRMLTIHTPIALIVVDEAHCVSEWGHDFRTAYLNIGRTSRTYCRFNNYIPPLLALTGTASRAVLKDVQRELHIEDFDAIITPKSFDRQNLKFQVIYSKSSEKTARLKGYLGQKLPGLFNLTISTLYETRGGETYSGLIFCPHVGYKFGVVQVSDEIRHDLNINTAYYSGKEPKFWKREEYVRFKKRVTKEFKRNKIPLLVCTKAFGMGIDKPNIRYTIHLGIPHSIESFYQEAGRAGRDKKIAHCSIIVSNDDPNRTKKLLDPNTKIEEIESIIKSTNWEENDDITRALYFHTNTFRGIAQEKQDIEEVLKYLGDISKRREKTLTIPDKITEKVKRDFKDDDDINRQARELVEKALYRFLLIEVVSDYTIDYDKNEFNIKLSGSQKDEIIEAYGKYVKGYYLVGRGELEIEKASRFISLPFQEFVLEVVVLLLHFIYDIIERGRRSSLYEMLLACSNFPTNSAIRQRILRYLEATEYSENLEQLIAKVKNGIIIKTKDVFSIVRSVNDAAELRGQVSRYLESYPDHPGLLMLRALSEVYSKDKDSDVVRQNSIASISSALNNYGLDTTSVFEFSTWAISKIAGRDRKLAYGLIDELLLTYPNRNFARSLIEQVPLELAKNPANFLLTKLKEVCDSLVLERTE